MAQAGLALDKGAWAAPAPPAVRVGEAVLALADLVVEGEAASVVALET